MKRLIALIVLLALAASGCSAPQAPISQEVQEQTDTVSYEEEGLYLFEGSEHSCAINARGEEVLRSIRGTMSILRDEAQKPCGIAVNRYEDITTDAYGWATAQQKWCDIYDPQGKFLFRADLSYAMLQGSLLFGYDETSGLTNVYHFPDGKLLYENVAQMYRLDGGFYIAQDDRDAPGFFTDSEGVYTAAVPEGYSAHYTPKGSYLLAKTDGKYGLLDQTGREALPFVYDELEYGIDGYFYGKRDGLYYVIDAASFEEIFCRSDPIRHFMGISAVVAEDSSQERFVLVDPEGNLLLEQSFPWVSTIDHDGDGSPDLLTCYDYDANHYLCFRPDGTMVIDGDLDAGSYYFLQEDLFLHQYALDDSSTTWELFKPSTMERTVLLQGPGGYCTPYYSFSSVPVFFTVQTENELGWYRTAIYDLNGELLLEDLQDVSYRFDDVLQVTVGFSTGLMRMDGTWLYRQSSFSELNDD